MKTLFNFLRYTSGDACSLLEKFVYLLKDNGLSTYVDIQDFVRLMPHTIMDESKNPSFMEDLKKSAKEENGKKHQSIIIKDDEGNVFYTFTVNFKDDQVSKLEFDVNERTLIIDLIKKYVMYEIHTCKKQICYEMKKYLGLDDEDKKAIKSKKIYFQLMKGDDRKHLNSYITGEHVDHLDMEVMQDKSFY